MGSEGDAKDNESDHSRSEFGPPLDDFGPPVSDFGPPTGDFGPPTGDFGPPTGDFGPPTGGQLRPQWAVPEPATDHPELIWRPADEPTVPPPPPQYRAPDSTSFADAPPARPTPQRPEPAPEPDAEATVRYATAPTGDQRETWWNSPSETRPQEPRPSETGNVPTSPSGPSGLSWADDPIFQRLTPAVPAPAPAPTRPASRGRWIALGVVAAVMVVIALVVTFVAVSRGDNNPKPVPPPATTTASLSCPAGKDGKVTRGNSAGDTASGPGAVLGFQYSFYVDRSGEKARTFVAPDAENVSTAEIIQQAINEQIPFGTTHCLRIAESATDTFEVDLTEHRPDGTTTVYRQTVTTANRDGKTLIFSIRERI